MDIVCDCCCMREAFHVQEYDGWAPADHLCDYCYQVRMMGDKCGSACEDWDEISRCYLIFGVEIKLASLLLTFVDKAEYDSILEMLICKDFDTYVRITRWIKRLWNTKDH
jgi:hypothetical protein